jgi:unspecific monooxygenase
MTLLVAGHETTATAIAWSLYWVHHLPDVGAQLRQEKMPKTLMNRLGTCA